MNAQVVVGREVAVVNLPPRLNARRREELHGFAEYCALRIERGLGAMDGWEISAAHLSNAAHAVVRARRSGSILEAHAGALDLAGAIWNAMCRIEQQLCERSAHRGAGARPAPAH